MSFKVTAYGVKQAEVSTKIEKLTIIRRPLGPGDVHIKILSASICHSDYHHINGDWFPVQGTIVPGHEIVGIIERVHETVTSHKVGDLVGVGVYDDALCKDDKGELTCSSCTIDRDERHCEKGPVLTYGSDEIIDGEKYKTYGGYSTDIVVNARFACPVDDFFKGENLKYAPPILCAGITTYTPLKRAGVTKGKKVGIVGIGGLGMFGIRIAIALGADVYAFTRSESKIDDLMQLGCKGVILTTNNDNYKPHSRSFDVILDTVSAEHDFDILLQCMRPKGSFALVGAAKSAVKFAPFSLIMSDVNFFGSGVGTMDDTAELFKLCAEHKILVPVEMIQPEEINDAYERLLKSDVKYRFSINIDAMRNGD